MVYLGEESLSRGALVSSGQHRPKGRSRLLKNVHPLSPAPLAVTRLRAGHLLLSLLLRLLLLRLLNARIALGN